MDAEKITNVTIVVAALYLARTVMATKSKGNPNYFYPLSSPPSSHQPPSKQPPAPPAETKYCIGEGMGQPYWYEDQNGKPIIDAATCKNIAVCMNPYTANMVPYAQYMAWVNTAHAEPFYAVCA